MEIAILVIYLFILGASLGSFINVVALRIPMGESIQGRSHCPHCQHQLKVLDLIPLISFLYLQKKCRYCQKPIAWRYFVVELLSGLFTVLFASKFHFQFTPIAIAQLFLVLTIIAISLSDLSYQVILDEFLVILFLFALVLNYSHLIYFLPGAFAVTFCFWLLNHFSYGRAMGFADVKFVFLIGLILPIVHLFFAIYLAFLTGGIISAILVLSRKKKLKSAVAFGPFLSIGFLIALWFVR